MKSVTYLIVLGLALFAVTDAQYVEPNCASMTQGVCDTYPSDCFWDNGSQTCSVYACSQLGSTQCYERDFRCHVQVGGSVCIYGAPTTCEERWLDPKCNAVPGCEMHPGLGCKTQPLSCDAYNNLQTQCGDHGCAYNTVNGQCLSCGQLTESACYDARSACHFIGTTCAAGAPQTCAEFYRDPTCATSGLCEAYPSSNLCADAPLPCNAWIQNADCLSHGCVLDGGCKSCGELNEMECYTQPSSCHFDGVANTCLGGAPQSCEQLYRDVASCPATSAESPGCYHGTNQVCHTSCIGESEFVCGSRSDCHWEDTCQNGAPATGCAAMSTLTGCNNRGCYWDYQITRCFNSLSDVAINYPCSTWSAPNYDIHSLACQAHGCALVGNVCFDVGSGLTTPLSNSTSFIYQMQASFLNPRIVPNTLIFRVDLHIPLRLRMSSPFWGVIGVGMQWMPNSKVVNADPNCNSVGLMPQQAPEPVYYHNNNATSLAHLKAYLIDWVNTRNTIVFDNSYEGQTLTKIFGSWVIGNGFLVKSVEAPIGTDTLKFSLEGKLTDWVNHCTGASSVQTTTTVHYNSLLTYSERSTSDGVTQAAVNFFVQETNTGVATITPNSRYPSALLGVTPTLKTYGCPAGSSAVKMNVTLQYSSIFDVTKDVGPRSLADISTQNPMVSGTSNCYGLQPVYYERLPRVGTVQQIRVIFETRCRQDLIGSDQTFDQCNNPNTNIAERDADMGIGVLYPPEMDQSYNFWVNTYSCPTGQPTSSNCFQINEALSRVADPFIINTPVASIYTNQDVVTVEHKVIFGLLPGPDAPLSALQTNENYSFNRTYQLAAGQIVIPVARLSDEELNTFNLTILPLTITFHALTSSGERQINLPNELTWTQMSKRAYFKPKLSDPETRGTLVPAVADVIGADGFGITVFDLYQLMPANGYNITLTYRVLDRYSQLTPTRRLLAFNASAILERIYSESLAIFLNEADMAAKITEAVYHYDYSDSVTGYLIVLILALWAEYSWIALIRFLFTKCFEPTRVETKAAKRSNTVAKKTITALG